MIDEKLIQAVISKKHSAFTIFYNEIVDHFFSYLKSNFSISNDSINDIISDTFVKIRYKIDSFNSNKWDFISWCWTILRNTTKDYFKKKNDIVFSDIYRPDENDNNISFEDTLKDDVDLLDKIEWDYRIEQIQKALQNLNIVDREILFLRFTEEKSLEEISYILGLSKINTRVRLHRAINKLRKILLPE